MGKHFYLVGFRRVHSIIYCKEQPNARNVSNRHERETTLSLASLYILNKKLLFTTKQSKNKINSHKM